MIKTTLKRRIGAILLSGALILGGAFTPSTAYADNGEEIVNSEITVSENEDISDEIADLSGGENVTTEEDAETVDTEEMNDGTDEESNVETVETTEDQSVDTETAQEDYEVDESDNTELDEGWEEVDESDLPPDDTVLDTIELQIEEIEELSEAFDESTVLESKMVIPENVLNSNAATKSTDTVEGDLVDLTDIYTGEVATHDCQNYLKVCHDGEHHWHECAVCGEKFDIKDHNFTTMGSDSCAWYNSGQTKYCEDCGYMTVYKRKHTDDTSKWITRPDQKYHYHKCTYCDSYGDAAENCRDANGNVIKCDGGTCAVCGYTYGKGHTYFNSAGGEKGTVRCGKCGDTMLEFDSNTGYWSNDNTYNASIRITGWNKEIFGSDAEALAKTLSVGGTGGGVTGEVSNLTTSVKNGYIYASCTVTFPYEDRSATWANEVWSVQPYSTRITLACNGGKIENRAPDIKSANVSYSSKNGTYSTKATLSVTCTDNWVYEPNYVQVRLVDGNKEAVSEWVTCAKSGNQYTQTIDLVTEVQGSKGFYVQARDAGGNVSEKSIELSNLDSRPPIVTSALTTSDDWSKMKTITFTCTDDGVGNVKIAFNDQSDYKDADFDGETYSRTYTFTGDVYGSIKAAVYFMDGAGNITTEFVEVKNLDNTCPEISMTEVEDSFNTTGEANGWNIISEGKDDNSKLSKSGSGITGYALTKDDVEPEETMYQTDKTIFLNHSGKYYLWVRDAAGNVTRSDDQIVIHSDFYFNGHEIDNLTYNGKEITSIIYNGKRIRL